MGKSGQAGQTHKAHKKKGRKRLNNPEKVNGVNRRTGLKHVRPGTNAQGKKRSRLQAAKSHRQKLRERTLEEKRLATHGPPKVVGLIPCTDQVDLAEVHELLIAAARAGASAPTKEGGEDTHMDTAAEVEGEHSFCVPDVKVRLRFLPPFDRRAAAPGTVQEGARGSMLIRLLDYVKIADVVIFVTHATSEYEVLDSVAITMCEALRAFGLPNVFCCIQGLGPLGLSDKARIKKKAVKVLTDQVRDSVNCLPVDTRQDCLHLFRMLKEHKQVVPIWRKQRPFVIVDECQVSAADQGRVRVALTGYVRGQNLSANQAFLLPGVGEFHLERVVRESDPFARQRMERRGQGGDVVMGVDEDSATLAMADAGQLESLDRENVPDPLAGDQTWPTEEEMAEAEMLEITRAQEVMKKVPRGFSEYQSAWINDVDDDDDDDDNMEFEDTTDEEEEGGEGAPGPRGGPEAEDGDFEVMSEGSEGEEEEEAMDMAAYADNYERERKLRRAAEDEDLEFPDEVDVSLDTPARERFIKYRGLKSFRTSPWDPKESLPMEYAKIFAFENPVRAQKQAKMRLRAGNKKRTDLVAKGEYVKLVFTTIPGEKAEVLAKMANIKETPYALFGLLQHETKMSLVNFSVHKAASHEEPLANKDDLVFYTGIRMFRAKPIISDAAPNVDKHRNQRFLRGGERCIFSVYAPIHHAPLPLLCFKETSDSAGGLPSSDQALGCDLVASGLVSSVDPDRVVLKRIVLTGYPHKVHKSRAYVRYMFHNPEDVKWFQPLEVWTKYGRRGKIMEPVGTHGTMKVAFDAVVQQRDTVCISLYKRVFPKWAQEETFVM